MISIVIPTHSRCDLISRAILSVQRQTYKDIEIIVVSDGSTDNTKKVVEDFASTDRRIRLIEYKPAKGGNVARNMGIEEAKGEFVAFLDDDDEWYPDKLEAQLNIMNLSNDIGLVYTGVHIIYANEKVEYDFTAHENGNLREKILIDNCIGTTSTVMVKKEILKEVGAFDTELRALQDYDLWIRICQECKVDYVPEKKINYYNYTGKNQISAATQKYIDAFEHIEEKYSGLFDQLSTNEKKEREKSKYYLLCNKALRNNEGRIARKYAKKAREYSNGFKPWFFWIMSFFPYRFTLRLRSIV